MDETLIKNGYNLIKTKETLDVSRKSLIEAKELNLNLTLTTIPKRLYDDLIKLLESHIDDINKEISEL